MLSTRHRARFGAATVAGAVLLSGCVPADRGGSAGEHTQPSAAQAPSDQPAGAGPIGISPGGVTTRIDEPAQSTEEQYAQACLAAKDWMEAKGGNPHDLIEPYLKEVQSSTESGPAAFQKTWAELTDPQRAAVIIAVRAAADGGC